ncbi:protein RCC2 isoform X3 [Acinonyx jubatus]|uniref:Protein RCC2 isoform X3 n=1 Tax=Acinonyx jubatus TaxID=32536 RepID=A0ABM3NWV2_ACIJB|nr:protein RCC2 isoform X3 [Acinonyx jubatus]
MPWAASRRWPLCPCSPVPLFPGITGPQAGLLGACFLLDFPTAESAFSQPGRFPAAGPPRVRPSAVVSLPSSGVPSGRLPRAAAPFLFQIVDPGRNEKGQLGHGDTKRVEAPKLIEGLSHEVIVSAACGRNHTLALTETGSVFAFGENKMGQLGLGNQTDAVPSPAQIMYNGQPITKMACGAEFSMIMDCKGNLYSFGCPEYGQLGHNSDGKFIARAQRIEYDCELVPRRVAIFIEKTKDGQILPVPNVVVRDVACGANHTLVLDSQKRVFSWGFGGYGRLGHAEQKDEMVPRLVKLFDFPGRGAAQIYAGYTCSFAVSEVGGLFFWGATNTSRESTMYPKAVQDLCGWRIRSLACGKSSIIVAADESTISWGPSPTFGELGYGDHKPKSSTAAQEVKTLDGIFTEQVAMGYAHSLVIARDESEAEKEKIKKLPEYNPRTL